MTTLNNFEISTMVPTYPRGIISICREFHRTSKKKMNNNKFEALELITAPLLKLKEDKSFNPLKIQLKLTTNNVYQKQAKYHER